MSLVFDGGKLERLRVLAGLSRLELAKRVGTTARSIHRWELGISPPRPHFVRRMASVFHAAQKDFYQEIHEEVKA